MLERRRELVETFPLRATFKHGSSAPEGRAQHGADALRHRFRLPFAREFSNERDLLTDPALHVYRRGLIFKRTGKLDKHVVTATGDTFMRRTRASAFNPRVLMSFAKGTDTTWTAVKLDEGTIPPKKLKLPQKI